MATFAPQQPQQPSHEADMRAAESQHPAAGPNGSHVNGLATQHNASAPPPAPREQSPTNGVLPLPPSKPVELVTPAPSLPEPTLKPIEPTILPPIIGRPDLPSEPVQPSVSEVRSDPIPQQPPVISAPERQPVQPPTPEVPESKPVFEPVTAPVLPTPPDAASPAVDAVMATDEDEKSSAPPVQAPTSVPVSEPLAPAPVEPTAAPVLPPADQLQAPAPPADQEMTDAVSAPIKQAREREDEDEDDEPSAKRPRTEEPSTNGTPTPAETISTPQAEPVPMQTATESVPAAPIASDPAVASGAPAAPDASVKIEPGLATAAVPAAAPAPPPAISGDFGPMTELASKRLMEGIRNLKKSKSSFAFQKPVDYMALNIPNYPNIVKHPMDLGTMEQKLKSRNYESVNDYVADFNQMVQNAIIFNGSQHAVAQAAMNLQSAFQAQLKKLPAPGEAPPPPKPRQPPVPQPILETKRRESRPSTVATPGGAQSPTNTFAAPNGVPTIRRDSSLGNRPKREIHRPPPKDLPYAGAKPRKKKFQAELQYCSEVLADMKRPRFEQYYIYFSDPVDPVALNIPTYRKIVKNPMDISTITSKLENNQYQNAKEFEKDWHLMFGNCYRFNGPDHPISKLAKEYENIFNDEMAKKDNWIAQNAPPSAPQSPAAASASESEEEDSEDEAAAARSAQLAQMHAQIAALQAQTAALMETSVKKEKITKKEKKKTGKAGVKASRKSGSLGGGAGPAKDKKSKPKGGKNRATTTKEKEEICTKIQELDAAGMARAAELIKAAFRRHGRHDLANQPDDDLEFDIDIIPEDGLHSLLRLVRELVPSAVPTTENQSSGAARAYGSAKAKKNKPMSSREQQDAVSRLESQIAGFDSGMGPNMGSANDSSDEEDDEDDESGSESEEE